MNEERTTQASAEMEDSEWEYEYDATEMEARSTIIVIRLYAYRFLQDFYVTLDLNASSLLPRKRRNITDTLLDPTTTEVPMSSIAGNAIDAAQDNAQGDGTQDNVDEAPDEDRIQIADLHGSNPIVSYQGRLYSCHWASTIGTDMLFTQAAAQGSTSVPLRSLSGHDLLGLSKLKLVAANAQLEPRRAFKNRMPTNEERLGVKLAVESDASEAKKRQAKFLERLSTAKVKRGEDRTVPASSYARRFTSRPSLLDAAHPVGQGRGQGVPGQQHGSPTFNGVDDCAGPAGGRGVLRPRRARGRARTRRSSRNRGPVPLASRPVDIARGQQPSSTATPATWDALTTPQSSPQMQQRTNAANAGASFQAQRPASEGPSAATYTRPP